jgi:hypothetical protein
MGADNVDADGPREAQEKGLRRGILAPNLTSDLLDYFLELEGISMNGYFKFADSVATGEVADGVPGQEKDHFRFAGGLPQQPQSISLVWGKPVFQKVNVVGHPAPLFLFPST